MGIKEAVTSISTAAATDTTTNTTKAVAEGGKVKDIDDKIKDFSTEKSLECLKDCMLSMKASPVATGIQLINYIDSSNSRGDSSSSKRKSKDKTVTRKEIVNLLDSIISEGKKLKGNQRLATIVAFACIVQCSFVLEYNLINSSHKGSSADSDRVSQKITKRIDVTLDIFQNIFFSSVHFSDADYAILSSLDKNYSIDEIVGDKSNTCNVNDSDDGNNDNGSGNNSGTSAVDEIVEGTRKVSQVTSVRNITTKRKHAYFQSIIGYFTDRYPAYASHISKKFSHLGDDDDDDDDDDDAIMRERVNAKKQKLSLSKVTSISEDIATCNSSQDFSLSDTYFSQPPTMFHDNYSISREGLMRETLYNTTTTYATTAATTSASNRLVSSNAKISNVGSLYNNGNASSRQYSLIRAPLTVKISARTGQGVKKVIRPSIVSSDKANSNQSTNNVGFSNGNSNSGSNGSSCFYGGESLFKAPSGNVLKRSFTTSAAHHIPVNTGTDSSGLANKLKRSSSMTMQIKETPSRPVRSNGFNANDITVTSIGETPIIKRN